MKATMEISDDVYRRVKAKAALDGRRVREITLQLYQQWLKDGEEEPAAGQEAERWLDDLLRLGEEAGRTVPPGPTATEILAKDRSRLDRR
ncbi:MAG: hypothetical protein NTV33_00735 [Coprothermobacterota bacterium]|nr:hypothetical protein [Coprothermobacterota bacterium]